jgi:hypothetical protein
MDYSSIDQLLDSFLHVHLLPFVELRAHEKVHRQSQNINYRRSNCSARVHLHPLDFPHIFWLWIVDIPTASLQRSATHRFVSQLLHPNIREEEEKDKLKMRAGFFEVY